ncbi:LPXTG cell wall anchor domain-containing protein [Actinomyces johnsonii]|uniref:LPXTG cell wall anchor domain-containing protein n=1 Tax=Actinomyces johnsonii TaxID=544581 RepID=A0A508A5R0_9ACTO|nr:LPXTG cell wall anchor domain-containing protein [Actinomyces johnsonii]TQD44111.1 LPXTG cell wall anchor domain-containing protein [Actinomyces johnsonii]
MRLGRPLAAASAVAAMTGASLIASPALANDSNRNSTSSPTSSSSPSPSENAPSPSSSSESHSSSSFRITQEKTFVSASTNSSFTVSGTGCTGQQATVGIALYAPDGTVSDIVKTEAAADGSWSTDLDLAALIKSIGSSTATTTDGWTIGAGCMTYGGKTETVQTTTQQQTQIFFDDTRISGSYEVSARTETQSQTFTFNAQGFYAGETVTVLLKHKSDSSIRYTLGELTVDANGNLVGNLPAPTDAADGEYLLVLTGSHHGETATSKTITTVSNHTFTINSERSTSENETTENNGGGGETQTNGGGEDKTTTDQQVNNQTNRSKSVSSGTKESSSDTRAAGETNTNNGKSLAHTGANGLIFGGIAALLVAIGGAVLFLRRRNKA